MKSAHVLLLTLIVSCISFIGSTPKAYAERDFAIVYNNVMHGSLVRTGNSTMTCDRSVMGQVARCDDVESTTGSPTQNNNNIVTAFIDVDGVVDLDGIDNGDDTYNSSTGTLTFPTSGHIDWAGVYWNGNKRPNATATPTSPQNQIYLRAPGGSYVQITADWCSTINPEFLCYADISALVRMSGPGDYTVANVSTNTGLDDFIGGWEISAAYIEDTAPLRSVTVYDGHKTYGNNVFETFLFDGFLTPLAGPVNSQIGVSITEGDEGSNDNATIQSSSAMMATTLSNALNPANDLGNATISQNGVHVTTRNPAYRNTLGLDLDVFDVTMANSDTSAEFIIGAGGGEGNRVYKIDFVTDIHFPDMSNAKGVVDLNGGDVVVGDILEYTVTVTNAATALDNAVNVVLTDILPTATTYVNDSMAIAATVPTGPAVGPLTDASDMDVARYDATTGQIIINLGRGATALNGGLMEPGDTIMLTFQVQVAPLENPAVIANSAIVSVEGETIAGGGYTRTTTTPSNDPGTNPYDPTTTTGYPDPDGDGRANDIDADNDGITNIEEGQGIDASLDSDGDLIADWKDTDVVGFTDVNNDGVDDRVDFDLDGVPNFLDLDSDGDGIFDLLEAGAPPALDANADGRVDATADANGDGLADPVDPTAPGGATLPLPNTDMADGKDFLDPDDDGDGIPTSTEFADGAIHGHNIDNDARLNWLDTDSDGDMILDELETFDIDVDSIPDYLDPDTKLFSAPARDAILNDNTPTFSGRVEAGATITLEVRDSNNTVVFTSTGTADAATGEWSVTPDDAENLGEGLHSVIATATDSGAKSATDVINVTIDTIPPSTTITYPATGSFINNKRPTITGTSSEGGVTIEVRLGATSIGTTVADANGAWSIEVPFDLVDGFNSAEAYTTDKAGNMPFPWAFSFFTVDTIPPTLSITSPASGSIVASTTTIDGTSSESRSMLNIILDEGTPEEQMLSTTTDRSGDWSIEVTNLAPGEHSLKVSIADDATNTTQESINFSVTDSRVSVDRPADGSTIADTLPALSGQTNAGATVTLILDEGTPEEQTMTLVANPMGAWFTFPATALTQGPHTLRAHSNDGQGGMSQAEISFSVDTVAPALDLVTPTDGSATSQTSPPISGTSDPNAAVLVRIDGGQATEVTADAQGDWLLTPATPLTEGEHVVDVQSSDSVGNTATDRHVFVVDTTAPVTTIETPTDQSAVSDPTPTLGGMSEPGATVNVTVDGTSLGMVTADEHGRWLFTPTVDLANGAHNISAQATDEADNIGPLATSEFTVDTTLPLVTIDAPASNTQVATAQPTFKGKSNPSAMVSVALDGGAAQVVQADAQGNWELAVSMDLGDGPHTVVAQATNNGTTATATSEFVVDTTNPTLTITAPTQGSLSTVATPEVRGLTEPNLVVTLDLPDGTQVVTRSNDQGGYTFTLPSPLSDGDVLLSVTATDLAGNEANDSVTVTIDTTPPSIDIFNPDDNSTKNDPNLVFRGTSDPNQEVTLVLDTVELGKVITDAQGNWEFTPTSPLDEGAHNIVATATDGGGNKAEDDVEFIIDTRSPDLVITAPTQGVSTEDTTPMIGGTSEPNLTVEVFVDGTKVGDAPTDDQGQWSYTLTEAQALSSGAHTVLARASDAAGNSTDDEVDFSILGSALTIDTPTDQSTVSMTPSVAGQAKPNAVVEVFIDGMRVGETTAGPNGVWSYSVPSLTPLSEGAHTVTARSDGEKDAGPVSFTVDADAHALAITSPTDGSSTNDTTPRITGTSIPNTPVTVFVNGDEVGMATTDENGGWTFDLPTEHMLDEGEHDIEATATKDGITKTSGVVKVIVDTTPPTLTIDPPNNPAKDKPTVTGTGEPGAEIIVYVDKGEVGRTTVGDDGTWSVPSQKPLDEGEHSITVESVDGAGNTSNEGPVALFVSSFNNFELIGGGSACATATQRDEGMPHIPVFLLAMGACLLGTSTRKRKRR